MHQNLRQTILRQLILHSSFTKFIFLLYYNSIIRTTIAVMVLKKTLKCTASDALSSVQTARNIISNLEKDFALPAYKPPLRIMLLGDSITYGVIGTNYKNSGGYRTELWNKFMVDELKVEFVGSQYNGPNNLGNKYHEGHCGWTIKQIAASVNEWLDTFQPNLILLMIGTNDTRKNSLKIMIKELSTLIDKITIQSPDAQLLVASIPPIHPSAQPVLRGLRAMYFNTAIPVIVESKIAQGKKVDFVDMRSLTANDLTSSLSLDLDNGVHPNGEGYHKIANFWHNAVLKVISIRQVSSTSA